MGFGLQNWAPGPELVGNSPHPRVGPRSRRGNRSRPLALRESGQPAQQPPPPREDGRYSPASPGDSWTHPCGALIPMAVSHAANSTLVGTILLVHLSLTSNPGWQAGDDPFNLPPQRSGFGVGSATAQPQLTGLAQPPGPKPKPNPTPQGSCLLSP